MRTRTRTLCIRRTLCRHVTIGTPMVIFAVLAKKTIGVPIVTGLPRLYQKQSKTAKTQLKQHKNDHWCTSRNMSTKTVPIVYQQCTENSQKTVKTAEITIGVPIVTCLHRVRRIHKAAQMPLPRETSITCAWAIATARRLWTGLTMSSA